LSTFSPLEFVILTIIGIVIYFFRDQIKDLIERVLP